MSFRASWKKLHGREGGYSDNPSDSGGPTNHGVTEALARSYGYTGHMRDLPYALAMSIAKQEFWDKMLLDQVEALDEGIAYELFDTGYNMGHGRAVTFIQRSLNGLNRRQRDYADLKVDGGMGPATLGALKKFLQVRRAAGRRVLLGLLNSVQGAAYLELVERREKDEDFMFGWIAHRVL